MSHFNDKLLHEFLLLWHLLKHSFSYPCDDWLFFMYLSSSCPCMSCPWLKNSLYIISVLYFYTHAFFPMLNLLVGCHVHYLIKKQNHLQQMINATCQIWGTGCREVPPIDCAVRPKPPAEGAPLFQAACATGYVLHPASSDCCCITTCGMNNIQMAGSELEQMMDRCRSVGR